MKPLAIIAGVGLSILFALFEVTCTGRVVQTNLAVPSPADSPMPGASASLPSADTSLPLRTVRDVPLSGGATRFDYQSFDPTTNRLYIAESGVIAIFDEDGRNLKKVGEGSFAPNARSVAVDSSTHRVYFPLQNVGGKPFLRIALPSDKQL